ncbi:MAG: hypothetical protein ACK41P_03390 [Asticcacaulis sp.]
MRCLIRSAALEHGPAEGLARVNTDQLLAANVNPVTRLATDYLNLFNEAVMLFEMAIDMPDMAEELTEWHRRDYRTHFENSGFELRHVVIEAYESADPSVREAFDASCESALEAFERSIHKILTSNLEDPTVCEDLRYDLSVMKALVMEMDSHIHGRPITKAVEQSDVDAMF